MSDTSRPQGRYQALDLWRGLICLFVVLEHATVALWQGAEDTGLRQLLLAPFRTNLGTPLFFVISGYCIASSVASCKRKGVSPGLFLARRFWRVFPPYWVALLLFGAMVAALDGLGLSVVHRGPYALELPSLGDLSAGQWLANASLTEIWRPILGGPEANVFTRVAWSLCYQEQFYLVCFLVFLASRKGLGRGFAIATAAILAGRAVLADAGALWRINGTFPILWHQFAVGIGAYFVLNGDLGVRTRRLILGLIALTAVSTGLYGDLTSSMAATFGLVMVASHRFDGRLTAIRRLEPLRAVGRRSYSIYLAHLPVLVLIAGGLGELGVQEYGLRAAITVPVSFAASLAAGWAFYRFVETRFLDIPAYGKRAAKPVVAPTMARTMSTLG